MRHSLKLAFLVLQLVMLIQVFLLKKILELIFANPLINKIGTGYSLCFDDHVIEFPDAERAPPESYFSRGYEA
jgi:hypothetical protein